jgi:hypothetical protein
MLDSTQSLFLSEIEQLTKMADNDGRRMLNDGTRVLQLEKENARLRRELVLAPFSSELGRIDEKWHAAWDILRAETGKKTIPREAGEAILGLKEQYDELYNLHQTLISNVKNGKF